MLAVSGGNLICLSTPFGRRGWFYDAWVDGSEWHRTKVTASECPRITAEFLAEERRTMGATWYAQEYECEFAKSALHVFDRDQIRASFDPKVKPLFSIVRKQS